MYKVTIILNNDRHITNSVRYIWADDICEKLNAVRRDAFTAIAGIIVQPEDISAVIIEEIAETVIHEERTGGANGLGTDSGKRVCGTGSCSPSDSNGDS